MKKHAYIAFLLCWGLFAVQGQSKQDSLQQLFGMVTQLQAQQQQMTALAAQRQADSLKMLQMVQQIAVLRQELQTAAQANATAAKALSEQQATHQQELAKMKAAMAASEVSVDKLNQQQLQGAAMTSQGMQDLKAQQQAYMQRIQELQDSLRAGQVAMQAMQAKQESFSEVALRLKLADEITYRHIRSNLLNTAMLYELLNEKLNALDAFKQLGAYQVLLQDLNNPSSNILGFSYNEKVLELLEEKLLVERDRNNSKILNFAKMLLESPVVSGLKNVAPVVNTASSLLSFISGVGIERKDITAENFAAFKQELEKYTVYYAELDQANSHFEVSLVNYQSSVAQLHAQLLELAMLNAQQMGLKPKERSDKEAAGSYLINLFQRYNKAEVDAYFARLEKKHQLEDGTPDYAAILKLPEVQGMYKRTENAMLLFRDFEQLYGLYVQILDENTDEVIAILEKAKENKLGKGSKVKAQVDRLGDEQEQTISSVRTAINLQKLARVADQLSKYPPAI